MNAHKGYKIHSQLPSMIGTLQLTHLSMIIRVITNKVVQLK